MLEGVDASVTRMEIAMGRFFVL